MTDRTEQWAEFVRGLARGDEATFKQGYSLGNALIAAAEQFSLSIPEVAMIVDQVAVANFESNGPSAPPQVYAYENEGGILYTEVTRGYVDVIEFDWDENAEHTIEELRDIRAEHERLADGPTRAWVMAAIDEEISELELREKAEAEAETERSQRRINEARQVLKEAGEL